MASSVVRDPGRNGLWWTFLTFTLFVIVVSVVVGIIFAFLASGSWPWEQDYQLSSAQWFDVVRSAVTSVGLFGLGGAALLAYRKQGTTESQHHLDRDRRVDARTAELRTRYTASAEQLGHEKSAVRLAGVYAMASLADDWHHEGNRAEQQVCIDVLCAYLRMPYKPAEAPRGEKEVRLTIISVIRDHLKNPSAEETWCGHALDFTGATFDGGNFTGAHFSGGIVSFSNAKFSGGTVYFVRAEFSGGIVSFSDAKFSRSTVDFHMARFSGSTVTFRSVVGEPPARLTFKDPRSWDNPPWVPWKARSVPPWVEPRDWPPRLFDPSS